VSAHKALALPRVPAVAAVTGYRPLAAAVTQRRRAAIPAAGGYTPKAAPATPAGEEVTAGAAGGFKGTVPADALRGGTTPSLPGTVSTRSGGAVSPATSAAISM